MGITGCPLTVEWRERLRDMRLRRYEGATAEAFKRAWEARLGRLLAAFEPAWEIAEDDESRMPWPGHDCRKGPFHRHAELEVRGRCIHIDRTVGSFGAPGRSKLEVHVFVDGELLGFGGSWGCSLGGGSSIDPAVALLGDGAALVLPLSKNGRAIGDPGAQLQPYQLGVCEVLE